MKNSNIQKTFLTLEEAASLLGTDLDGLQQSFEFRKINLPLFVRSRAKYFFASFQGSALDASGAWKLTDGRRAGETFPFDEHDHNFDIDYADLSDTFGDIRFFNLKKSASSDRYFADFMLEGFFRVFASDVKRAARSGSLMHVHVAPTAWWGADSLIPQRSAGGPLWGFIIREYDGDEPSRLEWVNNFDFTDALIRAEDLQVLLSGGEQEEAIDSISMSSKYVSSYLSFLNQASRKFWANAAPEDRSTHPTNDEVARWFVKRGLSNTLAEKAATIVRPDWAPLGRKKDE